MKRSDTGDFCVLYIEADDDRTGLFHTVSEQQKPVVIMLAEHTRVFQRPEDFTTLKHVKRQLDKPVVFVIPDSERMTQMAARNGFPVYASMDTLSDALMVGQLSRQRVLTRTTAPLAPGLNTAPIAPTVRKTTPLPPIDEILEEVSFQRPAPRVAPLPKQAMPLPTPPVRQRRRGRAVIVLATVALLVAALSSRSEE